MIFTTSKFSHYFDQQYLFVSKKSLVFLTMISKISVFVALWCATKLNFDKPMTNAQGPAFCAALYNMSPTRSRELIYFVEQGGFPAGDESMKCIFEYVAKAVDINDSRLPINETKLTANAHQKFVRVLTSEPAPNTNVPRTNVSSSCDSTYGFMKCVADLQNGIEIVATNKGWGTRVITTSLRSSARSSTARSLTYDVYLYLGLLTMSCSYRFYTNLQS